MEQIVQLLILERDKLSRAIAALVAPVERRGRSRKKAKASARVAVPPVAAPAVAARKGKRKPLTAARRKALSAKMKAYWAKRKKTAKS
jgi:hypothetical protein